MLISVGVMLPFANTTAHGIRQSSPPQLQRRYRRHSRAWWRRHRARMRLRRAALQAHRNAPLAPIFGEPAVASATTTVLPKLPAGWSNPVLSNNGEVRFRSETTSAVPSQATLAVVARSRPNPAYLTQREQHRMLAGTAFSDLRRIVIDKMIGAGGWVINDYERQVNGSRVFVVIAQTPSDGRSPEKSWNFYFAEVDGKIYSLTLCTPLQFADRLPAEGERFIASLRARDNANTQTPNR
ncbi:MAG TPA: hypothetical protein DCK93_16240 [Blastocatellia bacterium]|nr:hypothetical protein [Blastocatellia bacterium]HAF24426.1 hypothetical protein [Blastocatellia bacterium]